MLAMRRFSGRVTPCTAPMIAVVLVRRSRLRSARPLASASGIRIVVQQDQHAVGIGEVALILLDARARHRSAQFGDQRRTDELGELEVRDVRKFRPRRAPTPSPLRVPV